MQSLGRHHAQVGDDHLRMTAFAAPRGRCDTVIDWLREHALTVAQWSLLELHAGHGDQAIVDLQAAATVATLLLAGGDYTAEAQEAVKSAAAALQSLRQGQGSHAAAAVACEPLIEVFETLLRQVTLRRLHLAQDAAAVDYTAA